MPRASPLVTSFNAGEFSPNLEGRSDLAKYPQACKLAENFIVLPQGPRQRRPGFRYVTAVKDETKGAWLIRFEFSATQAFILEFGDLYVRFFAQHGRVQATGVTAYNGATAYAIGDMALSGGIIYYAIAATTGNAPPNATYWYPMTAITATTAIYEVPSPYSFAAMTNADGSCALQFVQSGDVLYIAHRLRTVKPYKLTRLGNTDWVFSEYAPNQGPFLSENTSTTTIIASALTGAITLTASAALFTAADVGRLVRLQDKNLSVEPWEVGKAYLINALARFDGKTYKAKAAATSGTSPPTHEQGEAADGKGGVIWIYQDAGYGIARITGFTSTTIVSATVIVDRANGLNQMPLGCTVTASERWRMGAWSATTGYPSSVTFYKNRLHWGGGLAFWASVPNDFENMSGDFFNEITIDAAISEQVQSQDVNDIEWMEGLERLVIGTGGGEFIVGPQTTTTPYGPANISIDKQSKKRARAVMPIVVDSSLCYVQRAGRKLLSMNYDIQRDKYLSSDVTILAERMPRTGILASAFQGEPSSIIWAALKNGKLLGFTYDQDQEVTGWHRHPIGGAGFVNSIATIPAPDGDREELWAVITRTINGATRRYIEFMEKPWEGEDQDETPGDDQSDAFYVDSGLTYEGAPTTSVTAAHLPNTTVQVLVDGAVQPDITLDAVGHGTLNRAGSTIQLGLQNIARFVPLKIDAGAADGSAMGKMQRYAGLSVRFVDTLGGKAGRFGGNLDDLSVRDPATQMGQPPQITSGVFAIDFPGDWGRDELLEIRQDQPLPMTIAAIMPTLNTSPT